jgi:hypothetical protein
VRACVRACVHVCMCVCVRVRVCGQVRVLIAHHPEKEKNAGLFHGSGGL